MLAQDVDRGTVALRRPAELAHERERRLPGSSDEAAAIEVKRLHDEPANPGVQQIARKLLRALDRQQRRHRDARLDSGRRDLRDRRQPGSVARAHGLEPLSYGVRIRRDGHVHADMLEAPQDVDVTRDERATRLHDQPRLLLGKRLEQPAHEQQATLDRLIGVRDAAHVDRLAGERRAHPVQPLERVLLDLHPPPPRVAALRVAAEERRVAVAAAEPATRVGVQREVVVRHEPGRTRENARGIAVAHLGIADALRTLPSAVVTCPGLVTDHAHESGGSSGCTVGRRRGHSALSSERL
jgi:hypothetical protein